GQDVTVPLPPFSRPLCPNPILGYDNPLRPSHNTTHVTRLSILGGFPTARRQFRHILSPPRRPPGTRRARHPRRPPRGPVRLAPPQKRPPRHRLPPGRKRLRRRLPETLSILPGSPLPGNAWPHSTDRPQRPLPSPRLFLLHPHGRGQAVSNLLSQTGISFT